MRSHDGGVCRALAKARSSSSLQPVHRCYANTGPIRTTVFERVPLHSIDATRGFPAVHTCERHRPLVEQIHVGRATLALSREENPATIPGDPSSAPVSVARSKKGILCRAHSSISRFGPGRCQGSSRFVRREEGSC